MNLVAPADTRSAEKIDSGKVVAETDRLYIRQLGWSDLAFMIELFGSLEVMRFSLTGPLAPPQVSEILDQFLKSYATQPLSQWGITEKPTGDLIGLCGFLVRKSTAGNEWELAYRFLPTHWRRGLATEAAIACRDLAFQIPETTHITALIEEPHTASIRVAEKVGLRRHSETQLQGISVLKYLMPRPTAS